MSYGTAVLVGIGALVIGSLGCDSPRRSVADDRDGEEKPALAMAANQHGEDVLTRILDSLLVSKPELTCFSGQALSVNRQVVSPLSACLATIADTSVYYYTDLDGKPLVVTQRFFAPPARIRSVGDSVYRALAARYGEGQECPVGPPDRAFLRHARWVRDGHTLHLTVAPFDTTKMITAFGIRHIRRVELAAWKGVSGCGDLAGEPGWR